VGLGDSAPGLNLVMCFFLCFSDIGVGYQGRAVAEEENWPISLIFWSGRLEFRPLARCVQHRAACRRRRFQQTPEQRECPSWDKGNNPFRR
jgi:hypothetical protein